MAKRESRKTHDAGAENKDEGRDEETHLATKDLPEWVSQEGTEEAAALVGRDDVGRDVGELLRRLCREPEFGLERPEGHRGTDKGRVVAVDVFRADVSGPSVGSNVVGRQVKTTDPIMMAAVAATMAPGNWYCQHGTVDGICTLDQDSHEYTRQL